MACLNNNNLLLLSSLSLCNWHCYENRYHLINFNLISVEVIQILDMSHLIIEATSGDKFYYYAHFTDKKTKAHRA